ncbi:MAG: lactonase family protein [Pseudonocardiaceae bacterium]
MKNFLFVQTNNPAGNQILAYDRADTGALALVQAIDTGGDGGVQTTIDPLDSQGSLIYDNPHRQLIAVNAGSNTVSVLSLDANRLRLRQVLGSGGSFPVSVTVYGELLYVLNAHETGSISGFRLTGDRYSPIEGSTRSLELTPVPGPTLSANSPGQVGFTPDGRQLLITTKLNGGLIDVFSVDTDGRPSENFVANFSQTQVPFGFTFDNYGRLAVTDAATSSLSTYTVNPDGTVVLIASQTDDGQAMCWVTQARGNLYVSDTGTSNLTGFRIDEAGKPTVFTKVDTNSGPIDLVATSNGQFLYVQTGGTGGVDGFSINPDGTLTRILTLSGLNGLEGIAAT